MKYREMIHYSDEAIVEGIRLRSDYIIKYVYEEYFPTIKYLITNNTGYDEDAEDVFQDALIIVFKKIKNDELLLSSSFKTYLYSICRNLWLQKLGKRKTINKDFSDVEHFVELPEDFLTEISRNQEENEKFKMYQKHFLDLGEDCQKVLSLFLKKTSLREIAHIMGFKTEKYAKTRKFLCKEKLKKRILKDPNCQKFFTNE